MGCSLLRSLTRWAPAGAVIVSLLTVALITRAAPPKRDWRIYDTQNFKLLTDGSDSQATTVLTRLERYRAAVNTMESTGLVSQLPTRVYLILSDDEWKWIRAASWASSLTVGIYRPTSEQNLLAISSVDDKDSDGQVTLHEFTHLLLRNYESDWPLWMGEGFAEALASVKLSREYALFGEPLTNSVLYLRNRGLIPMEGLFSLGLSTNNPNEAKWSPHLYPQGWAVAHYMMFALPPEKSAAAIQFRTLVSRGVAAELALSQALEMTPSQLQQAIENHIHSGNFRTLKIPLPTEVQNLPTPRKRPAAPGEVEAWFGDWIPDADKLHLAEERYETSLRQAPGNYFGTLGMGRILAGQGKFPEALERLRAAAAIQPDSGWAQYYLGRTLLLEDTRQETPPGSTNPAVVAEAVQTLKRATELLPTIPATFLELAQAYTAAGGHVDEALGAINQAYKLDPANDTTFLFLVTALLDHGQVERAHKVLTGLIARCGKNTVGRAASELQKKLQETPSSELPKLVRKLSRTP